MELRDGGGIQGRCQQKRQIYVKSLGVKRITGGRSSSGVRARPQKAGPAASALWQQERGGRERWRQVFAVHSERRGRKEVRWERARREGGKGRHLNRK